MVIQSTPIYHITHIDNLKRIIAAGGLVACGQLQPNGYTNIANQGIQDRRRGHPFLQGALYMTMCRFISRPDRPCCTAFLEGMCQITMETRRPLYT